jgi:hypothetical protein
MIRTKTRRKQKKHGKHGKTKKRIYGGGFLFDYSIWASKTITPIEKNEALNRIKSIVPNPKQPTRTGRLIKTALDELREKYYDNDIYDALDSKISELISKKSVDLKDIFDDKNKGDLKKLTKTNNFVNAGDVEMTELSSRPLMERKTEQQIDAQTERPPTPSVEEPSTAGIGEDLSMTGLSDAVEQSEETGTNERSAEDEAMNRTDDIRKQTMEEADAAVAKSNDTKFQIQQMIKQRETEEAIDLFDDVNDSLVEIIDTAEKQVASSKAKSAIDLFNVVNKDLKTMVDAVELDKERAAAEEARQIEIQNAKTEADRIAAEERFASEKARIDAIELFGTVNGHLQTMVEKTEAERAATEEAERLAEEERKRVAAEEAERLAEEERKRVAAEEAERLAEEERLAAEERERAAAKKVEAERIAAVEKAKSDAVSLFGTVNGYLQNMTEAAAEEERKRAAAEEAERLAEEAERERAAAQKLEEERIAAAEEAERLAEEERERAAAQKLEEERIAAAEKAERLAEEERERAAAQKLEEERIAAAVEQERLAEEAERERAAAQKLKEKVEQERLAAESLFKNTNQSMESIVGDAEAEVKQIAIEQERQSMEAERERIAVKSLLYTVQNSLDDIIGKAEIERAQETSRLEAAQLEAEQAAKLEAERVEAERVEAERAAKLEAERLEAERAAKLEAERLEAEQAAKLEAERLEAEQAAQLEAKRLEAEQAARQTALDEKDAAQSLFNTVRESLNKITGAAESTALQKEDIPLPTPPSTPSSETETEDSDSDSGLSISSTEYNDSDSMSEDESPPESNGVNYSEYYNNMQLYYPEDVNDTVMPKLGSITSADKLYVLRTVDNMVTMDPRHIYANEKAILDSKPLAIIPGYMVNDVDGKMTANDLLELLQSYYNYISKLTYPEPINDLLAKNDEDLLNDFFDSIEKDTVLNEQLKAEYQEP